MIKEMFSCFSCRFINFFLFFFIDNHNDNLNYNNNNSYINDFVELITNRLNFYNCFLLFFSKFIFIYKIDI